MVKAGDRSYDVNVKVARKEKMYGFMGLASTWTWSNVETRRVLRVMLHTRWSAEAWEALRSSDSRSDR